VLVADLDHVDGPRESRLVRVRRVATADEHTPRGIEPALDVVVHVMASHVYPLPQSGEPRSLGFRGAANYPSMDARFGMFLMQTANTLMSTISTMSL
jgi:hypothetical protein